MSGVSHDNSTNEHTGFTTFGKHPGIAGPLDHANRFRVISETETRNPRSEIRDPKSAIRDQSVKVSPLDSLRRRRSCNARMPGRLLQP